jgi:hypothetical protein
MDLVGTNHHEFHGSCIGLMRMLIMPFEFGNPEKANLHHHYQIETESICIY